MKKSLIALAVAGVVSAPAFAATSNVDVYGKLHVSVSVFDDQSNTLEDTQISSNASRIGFKGAEDLGGGLSAIWQIESGINMDETDGTWGSRNTFVGLKGGFGTVMIGNNDTPLKIIGRTIDLFGDTVADSRNVTAGANASKSDTRAKNSVTYNSPNFSGFGISAQYANSQATGTTGDAADDSIWGLNGTYTNGPLFLGLGYSDGKGLESTGAARGVDNEWRLAAGYSFGNFKLVGQYDKSKGDRTVDADFDSWLVGAAYTMGNFVLKANYMDGDLDGTSNDPKQWTIGADYNLSKRTAVYALYADGEWVTLGGGVGGSDRIGTGVAGGDISAFSVGVVHSF